MESRTDMWIAVMLSIAAILVAPHVYPQILLSAGAIIACAAFYFYYNARYPAIGLGITAVLFAANMLSLMVFLSTVAIVITGEAAYRLCQNEKYKFLTYTAVSAIMLIFLMLYLGYPLVLVPITGLLVAMMLKTIAKKREDALLIECIGAAMTMYLFEDLSYVPDWQALGAAFLLAVIFGITAYKMKAADTAGLISAALMGILIIVFTDISWFIIMLAFFMLGSLFTKYKYDVKKREGVAESRGGMRGFLNVYANGLISLSAAVLYGLYQSPVFIALFLGSISAAMADTTASELGMLGKTPRLITTMKPVPKGTDGGVTLFGETAALIASVILCGLAYLLGVASLQIAVIGVIAGFIGTNVDSLVGATLERNGCIHNTGTNFICTASGGLAAVLLWIFVF